MTHSKQNLNFTQREHDVFVGIMQGKQNKEIANNLGICLSGVKAHLKRMMLKTRVSNRVQLALYVVQRNKNAPKSSWIPIDECPKTPYTRYDMWNHIDKVRITDVLWDGYAWVCDHWPDAPYAQEHFSHYREIDDEEPEQV